VVRELGSVLSSAKISLYAGIFSSLLLRRKKENQQERSSKIRKLFSDDILRDYMRDNFINVIKEIPRSLCLKHTTVKTGKNK